MVNHRLTIDLPQSLQSSKDTFSHKKVSNGRHFCFVPTQFIFNKANFHCSSISFVATNFCFDEGGNSRSRQGRSLQAGSRGKG